MKKTLSTIFIFLLAFTLLCKEKGQESATDSSGEIPAAEASNVPEEKNEESAQSVVEKIPLSRFLTLDPREQAKYINSLSEKDKFLFLQDFLPNACFEIAMMGDVFFFPDGEVLFFHEDKNDIEKYSWSVQEDRLTFQLVQAGKKGRIMNRDFPEAFSFEWNYLEAYGDEGRPNFLSLDFNEIIYNKSGVKLDENLFGGFIYQNHGRKKCAGLWLPDDLRKYVQDKMSK